MNTLFPQPDSDLCRVCEEPVVDGRWNYCSTRCRKVANAVQRMFIWTEVREQVLERDDHTCQLCGLSREMAKRAYWQMYELANERSESNEEFMAPWRSYGSSAYDIFEVDHITRISDGGHPFDESNLWTLCTHCHSAKTAAENRNEEPDAEMPELTLADYLDAAGEG